LVYRSEPVAIVKEGLPALVIGMTWRGATAPLIERMDIQSTANEIGDDILL
jgi:hypothetical protein